MARGWRRGAVVVCLLVLGLAVAGGVYVTRPARLAHITAELLEWATGAEVAIERAYLSLDGGLQLEGVRFAVADLPGELPAEMARLGEIGSVRVMPDLWAMGRGAFVLRSIVLLEPTLYLTRHEGDERYNYQYVLQPSAEPRQQWLIDALPEIFVRGGRLQFAEVGARGARSLGVMGVEGRLVRDVAQPAVYRFTLHQQGEQLLPGVVLHGSLDLLEQRVSTELQGFQFTADQQQLLPAALRALWERLEPSGEMPRLTLTYDQDSGEGVAAELRMQNVAMTVPMPGVDARLRNVTALLRLSGDRLAIESLAGEIEGIGYELEGEIGAFDLNAPMRLKLVTDEFEIDTSPPPYLAGLPEVVHRHYARYEPTGRFQTTFEVRRDEQDGPLTYEGTVNVLGARGRYARFPVPAHDLYGQVHISQDEVRIEGIRGRTSTGATVEVEGTVTPPGREPAVDVVVRVRGGEMDDHLMSALSESERRIVAMFMDASGRSRLIDAGLVRDAAGPLVGGWRDRVRAMLLGEEALPPVFAFGGRVDADVYVTRERGPISAQAEVHLRPVGAVPVLFEHWTYPLLMTGGRVVIGPSETRLEAIELEGLTGGRGRLSGRVHHSGGTARPELLIEDATLPIDPLLLKSIPEPEDHWIRQLGLAGELGASGTITGDAEGETDFAITFDLADGQARPNHGAFTFTQVNGRVLLRRDSAEVQRFEGRRGAGRVHGEGVLKWAGRERKTDLQFTAEGLAVERALVDLLPAEGAGRSRAAGLFERHEPSGVVDAELTFGAAAGADARALIDGTPPYRLVVRPRALQLTAEGETFDLREMTGSVTLMAGEAELDELTARLDGGHVSASGVVMLDASGGAALTVGGELERVNGPWLALLPEPLTRTLAALAVEGRVGIEQARLLLRPNASEGARVEAVGELSLAEMRMQAGVPVEELQGTVTFDAAMVAGESMPRFALQLAADRLVASDREITPLSLTLRSDEAAQAVRLERLEGQMYGGVVVGHGVVDLQSEPGYQVELALQDVALEPFLTARERRAAAERAASENGSSAPPRRVANEGTLHANLVLGGKVDDAASRRGRGAIEIQQARLYQRPVALALLQAVNLSLPLSGSFDRGMASFLVEGETVYFDELNLEAASVAIQGAGTMHYPTGRLDLSLRARNPAGPNLGVLSDVFNLVKDQLVGIRITGTLDQPRARMVGLEEIGRPWSDAFNGEGGGE